MSIDLKIGEDRFAESKKQDFRNDLVSWVESCITLR